MRVLAADVGGTTTHLAVVEWGEDGPRILEEDRVPTGAHASLPDLVRTVPGGDDPEVEAAGLGIAGTMVDGVLRAAHLPWMIEPDELPGALGIPTVRVVNDLEAAALGLEHLAPDDRETLQAGRPDPDGPRAVLAAGTGLGEAVVHGRGPGRRVHPSEGGHRDFAPRTDAEDRLLAALRRRHGRVSVERVVSGPGLVAIHRWLTTHEGMDRPEDVAEEMDAGDPAAVVTRRGLEGSDPACRRALDLFCGALGAEAGNLVLQTLATGGVWLAGGIAPRIVSRLRSGGFLEAFRAREPLRELLEVVPVHVVTDPCLAVLGAADAAVRAARGDRGD